jgi:hypothetical protein
MKMEFKCRMIKVNIEKVSVTNPATALSRWL